MDKKNLLVVNDDGYQAEGIKVLSRYLSQENNVYVVAPDGNRSAVSNCITMYAENKIKHISENVWSSSGYPADCVDLGLHSNLFEGLKFDAVVSGINHGANMGTDIVYSGTCAAARQAVLCGVPGIAVSLDPVDWSSVPKNGFDFDFIAEFVAKNLEKLISLASVDFPRIFVNVNAAMTGNNKGAVQTDLLCRRNYNDWLDVVPAENQEKSGTQEKSDTIEYKTVYVPKLGETEKKPGTDYTVCMDGYISVSRVYADYICAPVVDGIRFSM